MSDYEQRKAVLEALNESELKRRLDEKDTVQIYTDGSEVAHKIGWAYLIRLNDEVIGWGHGEVTDEDITSLIKTEGQAVNPKNIAEWRSHSNVLGEFVAIQNAVQDPSLSKQANLPQILISDLQLPLFFIHGINKPRNASSKALLRRINEYAGTINTNPKQFVYWSRGHISEANLIVDQLARMHSGAKKQPGDQQLDLTQYL